MHDPPVTDEQLLRDFARGRESALGHLARRYEGSLLGVARGVLGGREDLARDAVQDAWLRVISAARGFEGRSSVKTWLYRIVVNRALDLRAKVSATPMPAPPAAVASALGALESDERLIDLRRAVDALPGEARLLLILCYHDGLSHAEAAEVLGLPQGTLKSRLHAALSELRTRLAPHAHEGARP